MLRFRRYIEATMKSDEEFWSEFRPGGGPPVDDRDYVRDSITQMGMAEHRPDVLYNALRDLGVEVSDAVHTGCGGGDLSVARAYSKEDAIQFRLWDAKIWATVWDYDEAAHRVTLVVNSEADGFAARFLLMPELKVFARTTISSPDAAASAVARASRGTKPESGTGERPQQPKT